ncbi:MAG: CDP-alcohol phosphatidyltransferase family protein [Marinosulfonomonas sp.]|nr:CDP-alcohol phosphatidyltransferase family protein [Marinosulfonomonas sp.]
MLDRHLRPLIDRSLDHSTRSLAQRGVSANTLTAAGLVAGLIAALCIALGAFWLALFFALASRLLDGLDGAVARASFPTALGGYLDILADFTFYAAMPVGFVLYDPALNGAAGAILLASFFINSASFLGYAILAEKHQHETRLNGEKSHFHATGLIEGTETITFFVICLLWPTAFPWLAPIFAALVLWTVGCRTRLAWRVFGG